MKSGVNLNISVFYTVFMTVYELLITKILARKLFGELVICPSAIGVGDKFCSINYFLKYKGSHNRNFILQLFPQ